MRYMKFMALVSFIVLGQNALGDQVEEPSPSFPKAAVQHMFDLDDVVIPEMVYVKKEICLGDIKYEVNLNSHAYHGVPNTLRLIDLYGVLPVELPTTLCYGDGDGTQWHSYRQFFVWENGRLVPREPIECDQPWIAVTLNFSPLTPNIY